MRVYRVIWKDTYFSFDSKIFNPRGEHRKVNSKSNGSGTASQKSEFMIA